MSSLCELPVRHRRGSDTSDEEGDSSSKICLTPPPIPAIPDVLSLPATEDVNSSRPDADNIGRLPISDVTLETYSELSQEDSDDDSVAPDVFQQPRRSTRIRQKPKYLNDFST